MDDTRSQPLDAAIASYWQALGQPAPVGEELARARRAMAVALATGAAVPRQGDKTLAPLVGPRRDLLPPAG